MTCPFCDYAGTHQHLVFAPNPGASQLIRADRALWKRGTGRLLVFADSDRHRQLATLLRLFPQARRLVPDYLRARGRRKYRSALWHAALGTFFGYPECCVAAFVLDCALDRDSSLASRHGSGLEHVPCAECFS